VESWTSGANRFIIDDHDPSSTRALPFVALRLEGDVKRSDVRDDISPVFVVAANIVEEAHL
jgi:hypothetical protein